MIELIKLWERFEKSGSPEDYLRYSRAKRAIEAEDDAAPSFDPSVKSVPKLP